jgi:pilus assembly protein CpaF
MGLMERLEKSRTVDETTVQKKDVPQVQQQKQEDIHRALRDRIHSEAIEKMNKLLPKGTQDATNLIKENIYSTIESIVEIEAKHLNRNDRNQIIQEVYVDVAGLGPLESLLNDESVTEIMVNGFDKIFVEKKGRLIRSEVTFRDNQHVMNVLDRIVSSIGRRIDESSPMVDARLADGSRVNAIIPPLSLVGPVITIRKFSKSPITVKDLIRYNSMTPKMARFLEACVEGRLNIVVSGGTGSGKTTLLNVLSGFIPEDERIVTIEDAAEIQMRQEHVVTLESRPANLEGRGQITIRDLVRNALRMRPDRIVVGEVRSGEALDMLQAMNTGHDGSLTTAHANTPRDLISRLETMVMMAGMELPIKAIREQIASAVDLVIQQSRLRDGSRKITSITEVVGMEGDIITLQDLYTYEIHGMDSENHLRGQFHTTGIHPKFLTKLQDNGILVSDDWFMG